MSFLRVFLVVTCICLATSAVAQHRFLKTRFICSLDIGTAHVLLHELVSYYDVNIEYAPSNLDTSQWISLPGGETTIGTVLNRILKGQRVAVIEKNNKIIIGAASTPLPPDAMLEKRVLFG